MKKLRLTIDSLRVDSFSSEPVREQSGTVQAHDAETELQTCLFTCQNTCETWICFC